MHVRSSRHQLLVYADVNLLVENINIINRKAKAILQAGKEVALEVNTDKTKYERMLKSNNSYSFPSFSNGNIY
jgi:hypothetical protein